MQTKELKLVKLGLVVVFSTLLTVYLILYQIKGETLVTDQPLEVSESQNNLSGAIQQTPEITELVLPQEETTGTKSTIKPTNSLFADINSASGKQKETTGNEFKFLLSGTTPYYGIVESVDTLGIPYQYALKDSKNIYYVFLGTSSYNFQENVRKLGGSLYTMSTEQEIISNKLFGEKVMFINLPEYKEKKVIFVVVFKKTLWLMQVDYANYHKSKSYIKSLFLDMM